MKFLRDEDYPTDFDVKAAYPEAYAIARVEGGWAVFPTFDDYRTWTRAV